jgi:hypothetical protein
MDENLCNSVKYAVFVCFRGWEFSGRKISIHQPGSTCSIHGLKSLPGEHTLMMVFVSKFICVSCLECSLICVKYIYFPSAIVKLVFVNMKPVITTML